MDPYDQPTFITIQDCLEHWGTPEFADAFLTEMAEFEERLPLRELCRDGNYPSPGEWAEFTDLKIDSVDGDTAEGSFHVSFTEESPTGCRDMPWKGTQSGRLHFKLDIKTGEMEFDPPRQIRQYDREEF